MNPDYLNTVQPAVRVKAAYQSVCPFCTRLNVIDGSTEATCQHFLSASPVGSRAPTHFIYEPDHPFD